MKPCTVYINVSIRDFMYFFPQRADMRVLVYALKEVLFAVDAVPPAEALLRQLGLAVAALEAPAVPVSVQHLEDEAVHDVLAAARTHGDLWRGTREDHRDGLLVTCTSITCCCCCYCCCTRAKIYCSLYRTTYGLMLCD